MNEIKVGNLVIALRDGNGFKAGTYARVTQVAGLDSEFYLHVVTENGVYLGPSLEDYWEVAGCGTGLKIRSYMRHGRRYNHFIYTRIDDRVEVMDSEGMLVMTFDAHGCVLDREGRLIGRMSQRTIRYPTTGALVNKEYKVEDRVIFTYRDVVTFVLEPTRSAECYLDSEVIIAKMYLDALEKNPSTDAPFLELNFTDDMEAEKKGYMKLLVEKNIAERS